MAIARDPRSTWKYVLLADRKLPREEQTVFELKHLTLAQEHEMLDALARDPVTGDTVRVTLGSEHLRMLRRGLVGFTNLKNASGTDVTFKAGPLGGADDEILFRLTLGDREELARAIESEIAFDPDEVGK